MAKYVQFFIVTLSEAIDWYLVPVDHELADPKGDFIKLFQSADGDCTDEITTDDNYIHETMSKFTHGCCNFHGVEKHNLPDDVIVVKQYWYCRII